MKGGRVGLHQRCHASGQLCQLAGTQGCERDNVPSALLETFSEVLAGGHTRSCKMLQPQMQAIQPRISIGAQPGGAFKGSACCAELTTVWTCWGCTDPSARASAGRSPASCHLGAATTANHFCGHPSTDFPGPSQLNVSGHAILGLIACVPKHDALNNRQHPIHIVLADLNIPGDVRALHVDANQHLARLVAHAFAVGAGKVRHSDAKPMPAANPRSSFRSQSWSVLLSRQQP